jgi:hypothetical protein
LAGFARSQHGILDQKSLSYLILNLVGSAVLTVGRSRAAVGLPAARRRLGDRSAFSLVGVLRAKNPVNPSR